MTEEDRLQKREKQSTLQIVLVHDALTDMMQFSTSATASRRAFSPATRLPRTKIWPICLITSSNSRLMPIWKQTS
jgi:hypothetical protein